MAGDLIPIGAPDVSSKDSQPCYKQGEEELQRARSPHPAGGQVALSVSPSVPEVSAQLETVYAECASFVWRTLQRFGVRKADLDDLCHDVFVIVHRKLPEFRSGASLKPWLLAICARTAANYRRKARLRLEQPSGDLEAGDHMLAAAPEVARPDNALGRRRALQLAETIVAQMPPVKRAVFIMFEVEGMSCQDIADELALPVGTVYSRLHSARKIFLAQVARHGALGTTQRHD